MDYWINKRNHFSVNEFIRELKIETFSGRRQLQPDVTSSFVGYCACSCSPPCRPISFPEAAILLVSDGDRDLWPAGILSPQIADFRLHCAESKVKPKMAERSGPDTFLEGVKFGLEKVGKANITLKQKQKEILKIIALTQKDVLAVLPTGYGKSKKDWHSAY